MEEYGEAMGKMIDASEENKSGHSDRVKQLEKEKEQAEEDLRKTETAFSDLHHKYEKTKELVGWLRGWGVECFDRVACVNAVAVPPNPHPPIIFLR